MHDDFIKNKLIGNISGLITERLIQLIIES